MNLRRFKQRRLQADLGANGGGNEVQNNTNTETIETGNVVEDSTNLEGKQNKEEKTFTQDDLDRIISRRLEKAQKKWEEQTNARIEEVKVSQMSDEDRKEYEKNKKDLEFKEREANILKKELRLEAMDVLISKNLPKKLIDIVDTSSKEGMEKSISIIESVMQEGVSSMVNERLRGGSIPRGSIRTTSSKDPFLDGLKGNKK